jgi:hypothetical protein
MKNLSKIKRDTSLGKWEISLELLFGMLLNADLAEDRG